MMDRRLLVFFCSFAFLIITTNTKQYRSDYEYNRKTDAFYKFHIETATTTRATGVCFVEGAELMVPSSKADIQQVHAMFKQFPDLGNFVLVGDDGEKHESAEEQPELNMETEQETESGMNQIYHHGSRVYNPTCEAMTRSGEVETVRCTIALPFVCKVEAKNAPYDSKCQVISKDYRHFEETGSCYKLPQIAYNWNEAYDECQKEGAHLLIINSDAESRIIRNLTQKSSAINQASASYFFHVGVRANKPTDNSTRVFRTVFNETLEIAGFNKWSENEPNNYNNDEYCGTLFSKNGKYNDINCQLSLGFICEKEVHVISRK